jgi:hypothetical protein
MDNFLFSAMKHLNSATRILAFKDVKAKLPLYRKDFLGKCCQSNDVMGALMHVVVRPDYEEHRKQFFAIRLAQIIVVSIRNGDHRKESKARRLLTENDIILNNDGEAAQNNAVFIGQAAVQVAVAGPAPPQALAVAPAPPAAALIVPATSFTMEVVRTDEVVERFEVTASTTVDEVLEAIYASPSQYKLITEQGSRLTGHLWRYNLARVKTDINKKI